MASKELNEVRLNNAMLLFSAFCEQVAPGEPDLRGLDKAFALNIGISPSHWSQIKSEKRIRGIGPNLARKLERKMGMQLGWLDKDHGPSELVIEKKEKYVVEIATLEEKEFLEASLAQYRDNPVKALTKLIAK